MPAPPKVILFDAVGTLMHPEPPVAEAYAVAGRRFGVDLAAPEIARRFRTAVARQDAEDLRQPNMPIDEPRERRRWQAIVGEVFPGVASREELFHCLWGHFAQPCHWRLFDDVLPAWNRLTANGLRLAIASNFDARLEGICRSHPPLDECRHVFISSQIGSRKPHRSFFHAIGRALGLPARELMLVGDNEQFDYGGACDSGWQAILLDRESRPASGAAPRRISNLAELPGAITAGSSASEFT